MAVITVIFLLLALLFFTGGSVGIIRFPDFYTRLHPAGKLDTMGLLMAMAGMACYTLDHFSLAALLTSLKIMLIVVFVFITSPTATHAIMDAGARASLRPWTRKHMEEEEEE